MPLKERQIKHLSITSLCKFARCPRLWEYQYKWGLGETFAAMQFGTAIHRALPHAVEGDLAKALDAFRDSWDVSLNDVKRNPETATRMILDFFEGHVPSRAMYEMLPRPELAAHVSTESPWEIPFALDVGLEIPLVGYIDGLVRQRTTGELWALEWKTTSEDSGRFLDGFRMNPQAVGYALALRMMKVQVQGTIVESLLVSKYKTSTLANPVTVDEGIMEEFVRWARWRGEQLLASLKTGYFPKDLSHCNTYPCFGVAGFTCDHQPLCLVGEGWREVAELMPQLPEREFVLESQPLKGAGQ